MGLVLIGIGAFVMVVLNPHLPTPLVFPRVAVLSGLILASIRGFGCSPSTVFTNILQMVLYPADEPATKPVGPQNVLERTCVLLR